MMLGKDRMAELRSIAKSHKLAVGSQTVSNSVVEIAAALGQSPPVGPSNAVAFPALERKKIPLKRAKRKATRVVSDEEEDESTELSQVFIKQSNYNKRGYSLDISCPSTTHFVTSNGERSISGCTQET